MIALEASADDPATTTPGKRTFYGRLVGGSAADNREPLSPSWHASLDSSALAPAGAGETELLVWRDAGVTLSSVQLRRAPCPVPPTHHQQHGVRSGRQRHTAAGGSAPGDDATPDERPRREPASIST